MDVADVGHELLKRGDDIAFLHLHVVDVVEQLYARAADALTDVDAPRGVVTLVVRMVALGIEQLHAQRHLLLFGKGGNLLQRLHAVVRADLV